MTSFNRFKARPPDCERSTAVEDMGIDHRGVEQLGLSAVCGAASLLGWVVSRRIWFAVAFTAL